MSCKSCGAATGSFVKDGRTLRYRTCFNCRQAAPPAPECVVAGCTKSAKDHSAGCWIHRREMAAFPCRRCGMSSLRRVSRVFCKQCYEQIVSSSAGDEFLSREEQKLRDEIRAAHLQRDTRRVHFDPADLFD